MADTKTPEAILQDALTAEQNKNKELTAQLTAAREDTATANRALTAEQEAHAKIKKELGDTNEVVLELNNQINELSSRPAAGQAHQVQLGTGTDVRKFEFTAPLFSFQGQKVRATEVKSNSDLLQQLVEAGAGVLKPVK